MKTFSGLMVERWHSIEQLRSACRAFGTVGITATAFPIVIFLEIEQSLAGQPTHYLAAACAVMSAGFFAAWWSRGSEMVRQTGLVFGFCAGALLCALHFGLVAEIGLMLGSAVLLATLFAGLRGSFVVVAFVAAAFVANRLGLLFEPPVFWAPETTSGWLRAFGHLIITLAMIGVCFDFLLKNLEALVDYVEELRAKEKAAHEEREAALRRSASADRLNALGRLAGGVAHDFNNTLAVIRAGAALLNEPEFEADERDEIVDDILEAVDAAVTTTRQLKTFARGEIEPQEHSLPHVALSRVVEGLRKVIPANVELVTQSPLHGTRPISLSEGALHQVFLNLSLNARDALVQGGVIELGCAYEEKMARLWVRDDGEGISEEALAHIFEPFFTTKGEDGTGLGLTMVHNAALRAGGTVHVESVPGEGTTVTMVLPLCETQVEDLAPAPDSGPVFVPRGARVLVVDDRLDLLRVMTRELQHAGFEVTMADSVARAEDLMSNQRFDVLVTDGILADGCASDNLRAWRSSPNAENPAVICSGYLKRNIHASEAVLECPFLAKPYAPGALVRLVASTLDNGPIDSRKAS